MAKQGDAIADEEIDANFVKRFRRANCWLALPLFIFSYEKNPFQKPLHYRSIEIPSRDGTT